MRRITLLTNPDICNLKCPLCFLQQRGRSFGMGEMPFETAVAAIQKYEVGLEEVIPSTMGEPLLYSSFSRLLDFCSDRRILLNLTTNGTFPGMWGKPAGYVKLLRACSDIKISGLAFESGCNVQGTVFDELAWKGNVERLLDCRKLLKRNGETRLSTVSLQMTLHRKNACRAEEILRWAESVGVHRIKWNPAVFLSTADSRLVAEYGLEPFDLEELRGRLVSTKLKSGGSLFFEKKLAGCGTAEKEKNSRCAFQDEIWILPDGSEQNCPNPERRFGNPGAASAQCENCVMK